MIGDDLKAVAFGYVQNLDHGVIDDFSDGLSIFGRLALREVDSGEWHGGCPYQLLGVIFPAKVWVTIFPLCTMKVSVPISKTLSADSAFHTM
jgi:hypothetical protein